MWSSMVKKIRHEGKTIYVCEVCGLVYDDILLAYSCNEYCRTHDTPWDEIAKKAIYIPQISARDEAEAHTAKVEAQE